ncbi:MAG TPA: glycosyltransferase family 2 protein [Patescibacteria group bacterium]|nr:glycosyltransferase family 2 protein [Patescibacteria group bacterium]
MQNKKILIIIPAYNEAGRVDKVVAQLRAQFPSFDLLVVDDCSSDATACQAREAGSPVVSLPFNLGIGGAVQTGFQYAKHNGYDVAIQVDADGQHDPASILDIARPVIAGELDLCIGSRFTAGKGNFKSSFLRRIGIRFFVHLIGILTGVRLTDPTSGFRAYGKKAIDLFAAHYPIDFPEPESIVIAKRYQARIGEVPALMHPRQGGSSSIRYLKTAYYMIKVTVAIMLCTLSKNRRIRADEH